MGLWDAVGGVVEGLGDDLLMRGASIAGFALGGPPGAALAGGIVGGVTAGLKGENILLGAGLGAGCALIGGLGGVAFRAPAKGMVGGLLRRQHSLDIARRMTGPGAGKIAYNQTGLFAKTIPDRLGGAHLSPWKTRLGLLGSFFAPESTAFLEGIPDKWNRHTGYPEIVLIDISEEELASIPDKMPHIMMPDPARLPEGLVLTPPVEANYRTLPTAYAGYWDAFGEKPGKLDPPKELNVSDISGEDKAGVANYPEKVDKMRKQLADLRSKASKIEEVNQQTSQLCGAGRNDFAAVVEALKSFAELDARGWKFIDRLNSEYSQKVSPYSGLPVFEVDKKSLKMLGAGAPSEDAYAMVLIEAGYGNAASILGYYVEAFKALGVKTESEKPTAEQSRQPSGSPQNTPVGNGTYPVYTPAAPQTGPTAQTGPPAVPAPTPWDLTSDTRSGSDANRSAADRAGTGTGVDPLGTAAGTPDAITTAAAATPVVTPAVSTAANGMGSALQSMLRSQLMQTMLGQTGRGAPDEREGGHQVGRDRPDNRATVAAVPTPAPTTNAAPAAQAPGQTATAPNGDAKTVSARPDSGRPVGKPMPAAVAQGADNAVYTYPDSRTQEVSAVMVRVLDAAFGNAAGTDARSAYTGTPAEWTDPKRIGRRTDPSEVMTGDVCVWEERTAVLVAFDGQDTLEAVVDGALMKIADLSQMRDGAGEFGGFVGIFHPPGIEKVADKTATTAVPGAPVDLSAPGAVASV